MGRLPVFVLGFSLAFLGILACSPPPGDSSAPVPAFQPTAQPVAEPTAPPNPWSEWASPPISSGSAPVPTSIAPQTGPAHGPVPEPAPAVTFSSVGIGSPYSCAFKTDGTVDCRCRAGPYSTARVPTGIFTPVPMGSHCGCGVRENGALACWVYDETHGNSHGQAVLPSAGSTHNCAIKTDGSVVCWGLERDGQTRVPGERIFTMLALGPA